MMFHYSLLTSDTGPVCHTQARTKWFWVNIKIRVP